ASIGGVVLVEAFAVAGAAASAARAVLANTVSSARQSKHSHGGTSARAPPPAAPRAGVDVSGNVAGRAGIDL
uniref:hypothetical protein n=1 Tax=Burkholderia gladioli TaxID=28095 RepID=UPI0034DB4A76